MAVRQLASRTVQGPLLSFADLGVPTPTKRPATRPSPAITYLPGTDVARVPGFYNPGNPYDTGRAGEKNPEMAAAAGLSLYEDLAGWDYDLGRPMNANAKTNSQGYYTLNAPSGGGGGGGGSSSDPMLQKIRALAQQSLANARAQAQALRKQAAIETGDEAIAREIGLDDTTIAAVAANPFSRRKNFLNEALAAETQLEQGLNADNLFYSGHRINELADLGRKRAEGEATIGGDLRAQLALIDQNLAQAEYQAQLQELEAQRQAMLDALMNGGYGYGDGGGDEYYEEEYEEVPWEGGMGTGLSSPQAEAVLLAALAQQQQKQKNPYMMLK